MCWDKTGTLTVPELLFQSVDRAISSHFQGPTEKLNFTSQYVNKSPQSLERVMVSCHQVTKINDNFIGHSLDIEALRFAKWKFVDDINNIIIDDIPLQVIEEIAPPTEPETGDVSNIYILKRFEFDAQLQACSVISTSKVEAERGDFYAYCKGSPEAMLQICIPESIPENFNETMQKYFMKGYYVIACGYKKMKLKASCLTSIERKSVESELEFLGFLLFQNPLKEDSTQTIQHLKDSKIRNVIVTGDNALSAVHVCRNLQLCTNAILIDKIGEKILYYEVPYEADELNKPRGFSSTVKYKPINNLMDQLSVMPHQTEICITGPALSQFCLDGNYHFIDWVVRRTRIFSRIKPDQKTWIIQRFIDQGKCVGMCGDGLNDFGALREGLKTFKFIANVGLALGEAEACVVAPFTSTRNKVSDIITLIREGRGARETSFLSLKVLFFLNNSLCPCIRLFNL